MPLKKDGTGRRWVEMERIVPGTVEEVWQAIATGPGNTAWFTPTTIEERIGGRLTFDFDMFGPSHAEVTAWQPPLHFAYVEREWAEAAPPLFTEITVTARSGGRCMIRMVHSLFSTNDDWDDQIEGFESGWPAFFEVLRLYLAHAPGLPSACVGAMTLIEDAPLRAWTRYLEHLGLSGAHAGAERTARAGDDTFMGVVERIEEDSKQRYLLLRLAGPVKGAALLGCYDADGKARLSFYLYLYGDDAAATATPLAPRLRSWLDGAMRAG